MCKDEERILGYIRSCKFLSFAFLHPARYRQAMNLWCGIGDYSIEQSIESIDEKLAERRQWDGK